ncbi:MAG TPA: purine-nucleoside phosphorylase, partial [Firmicutes bacterium]|nr:purine-nucleoside phosphorylase [Bacillota bacterium]
MDNNLAVLDPKKLSAAIAKAASFIQAKTPLKPRIGIVLGSGLGALASRVEEAVRIPFANIPNFPAATIAGHQGQLIIGRLEGREVVVMQGRVHYYEGYSTNTTTFPIRVLAKLGIDTLILTNACGGVNKHFSPGELMVIEDHLSLFAPSPLRGPNLDEFGERFVDMYEAYTPELISLAQQSAKTLGIKLQKGIYGYWQGPTYETAAEIRAYMALGADVVGMSTVPEAIVARHCGLKLLGISCITNMTCIYTQGTSHAEVVEMGRRAA